MEFDFYFPLPLSKTTLTITVEADVPHEQMEISISLPFGSGDWLFAVMSEASVALDEIERSAWEKSQERWREILEARGA